MRIELLVSRVEETIPDSMDLKLKSVVRKIDRKEKIKTAIEAMMRLCLFIS
jgi:hypothetical protein